MSWPRPPRRNSAPPPALPWRIAALRHGRAAGSALFIQTDFAALEAGAPYGPGLDGFGLPMERLIMLRVPRPIDALWACEEALKSRGVAVVIAELPEAGDAADLTATRRLTLAARAGGGLGLLLRHRAVAARHRGHHPLAGRRRAEHARPLRRARPHRLRSFAEPEPARPLRPLHRVLGSPCVRLPPAALSLGVAAAADDGSADPRRRSRARIG